jgi:hypothetical protein
MSDRPNLQSDESINGDEIRSIQDSTRLKFNLDTFFDTVVHGRAPITAPKERRRGGSQAVDPESLSEAEILNMARQTENQGVPLNQDGLLRRAMSIIGEEGFKRAMNDVYAPEEGRQQTFAGRTFAERMAQEQGLTNLVQENAAPEELSEEPVNQPKQAPGLRVTVSQAKALQKYPQLIEFLGREGFADRIAKKMISEINNIVAEKIGENTKKWHKCAVLCKSDKHNLKQYFQGADWVCCITASGVFRGDEIIYYKRDEDGAYVLRPGDQPNELVDVSWQFNIIHEYQDGISKEDLKSE